MGSVPNEIKREARRVTEDILNRIGGTPFHKAVEELCAAVIELIPGIPEEKTGRVARALGNLQEASLSQTTSTAAATIVAAVSGFEKRLDAHEERCEQRQEEVRRLFAAHLREHEAGQ